MYKAVGTVGVMEAGEDTLELQPYAAGDGHEEMTSPMLDGRGDSSDASHFTLYQCARDGNVENMQQLMAHMGSRLKKVINWYDENKLTPLHYAARYNRYAATLLLLQRGADPNVKGEDDARPLHLAAKSSRVKRSATADSLGDETEDDDGDGPVATQIEDKVGVGKTTTITLTGDSGETVAEVKTGGGDVDEGSDEGSVIGLLVEYGARVNAQDQYGSTPLHYAAIRSNVTTLAELLDTPDIDIEASDKQLMAALHLSATHDSKDCCQLLVQRGAQLRCADDEKSTPMHMAATEGNVEIMEMLLLEADKRSGAWVEANKMMSDTDNDENTPLHLAVENGHFEAVKLCLSRQSEVNKPRKGFNTPLHLAAAMGDMRIVELLVESRARVDAVNHERATPLHRAASFNHTAVIKYLLKKGSKIERTDNDNFTALLIAASEGHTESVKALLAKRANIFATDKNDRSAVFWAAQENKVETLRVLLNHKLGKDLLSVGDNYDNVALHVACEKGYLDVVKLLLEMGADLDEKNEVEQTPCHLAAAAGMTHIVKELVKQDRSIVQDYDENSNTPLHLAALEGHFKVGNILIDAGADIVARNQNLWTPIDCAAATGHVKMVKCLLNADSPIDPTDRAKVTPLHLACQKGHPQVVHTLLKRGADVTLRDANGLNCIDMAIDSNNRECVQALLDSDRWLDAMRHAHIDPHTGKMNTPMRKLIRKMPELAEQVFHKCTTSNDEHAESTKFKINFNYELLDDQYSINSWTQQDSSTVNVLETSSGVSGSIYDESHRVRHDVTPYHESRSELKKNHPLLLMVTAQREDLLAHPLVTSLLRHKWNTMGRFFYYINLFTYCLFLLFLTAVALEVPSPQRVIGCINLGLGKPSCILASCDLQRANQTSSYVYYRRTGTRSDAEVDFFLFVSQWVVIGLICFKLVIEVLQMVNTKLAYFDWENILEWIMYGCSLMFVIPWTMCTRDTGFREPWQWQLGCIAVFLAWMDLVLFIRKLPRFGIYVVMFTDILATFAQFFVVFFLFIVAFALTFYMLFQNQDPFKSVGRSIMKTAVMMIGEFEFDTIFNDNQVDYEVVSYIIFIAFAILMSILIMNLLVGLAVDDIKAVQEQAVLKRLAMQVELALNVEAIIPTFISRRYCIKIEKFYPNSRKAFFHNISSLGTSSLSSGAIANALNPELDDLEKVVKEQEESTRAMKKMDQRLKDLSSHNQKLESMLTALIEHHKVEWSEIDEQSESGDVGISRRF